ncbi:TPA: hypothetical protein ACGGRZ_001906 [Escherichia coli]|uniref:hypothetical protein n=1 Tax=Escherichia coli TaxID=562 RepID=UPI0021B43906|nr:hypothetical protein [Escherichia coli]
MVSRIFFPIGQGAFYAEKHETFNVVYDCGNWKQTNLSKKVVSQSFSKSEGIKILFISHFDWDHISLIKTLKRSVCSIDYVILPLLHENQKILLRNLYRPLDYDAQILINSPENFFGEGTKIIYITPAENNEVNDITINIDDESESAPSTNISSGTIVKVSGNNYDWCFIPFNIKNNERARGVEEKLESAGFDVEKLKTEPSYTINNIISKADKNKLKNIYNSLQGKINENSLVIYSGPSKPCGDDNIFVISKINNHMRSPHSIIYNKVGCIYTGDVDLNEFEIKSVYSKYWNMVGTVQIPHHGAEKDFDPDFLKSNYLFCPISFGVENTYGHPSYKVISNILSNDSEYICVTEKMDSGYIQCLRFK